MNTRFGHVSYTKLGIRHARLRSFCRDFNLEYIQTDEHVSIVNAHIDSHLDANFVYFLLENKTFIRIDDLDYYSNKTIEIISNKIGRKVEEIENYLRTRNYVVDIRNPFRYISSYKIDYDLGGNYDFLKYNNKHLYEGNFEYRRRSLEH